MWVPGFCRTFRLGAPAQACAFRKLRTQTPQRDDRLERKLCRLSACSPPFQRLPRFLEVSASILSLKRTRCCSLELRMLCKQEQRPGVALAVGKNVQSLQSQPSPAGQQATGEAIPHSIVNGAHLPPLPVRCGTVRATETVTLQHRMQD